MKKKKRGYIRKNGVNIYKKSIDTDSELETDKKNKSETVKLDEYPVDGIGRELFTKEEKNTKEKKETENTENKELKEDKGE